MSNRLSNNHNNKLSGNPSDSNSNNNNDNNPKPDKYSNPSRVIKIIMLLALLFVAYFFGTDVLDNNGILHDDSSADGAASQTQTEQQADVDYVFRNESLLESHFQKHGEEFDYATMEEYQAGASAVINSPDALYKTEAEDGDGVYYLEATNEFVILAKDGYIRTYFKPNDGLAYFNRQ